MALPNPYKQLPIPLEALYLKMLNGYSPLVCVVGDETGIGKTRYTARSAELLLNRLYHGEKLWKPSTSIFYSMTAFKTKLFDSNGEIFAIEEAELELGSDSWQSIANRWFSRIKDTQRIKGNLYFVVLPIFMALARKHRRRVNYIFDVKSRGFANVYKIKKYSAQILGDEMGKIYIGSMKLNKPDCDMELDVMDRENKNKIEIEQGEIFDRENEIKTLTDQRRLDKLRELVSKSKANNDTIIKEKKYIYECHNCNAKIESNKVIDRVVKCHNCNSHVYITEQNLKKMNDDI